jgi:hypothetical protein
VSTHFAADPTASGAAVFPARPEWLTVSAAFADEVPVIADRDDLVVSVAPARAVVPRRVSTPPAR